jgi:hypothetical protein
MIDQMRKAMYDWRRANLLLNDMLVSNGDICMLPLCTTTRQWQTAVSA